MSDDEIGVLSNVSLDLRYKAEDGFWKEAELVEKPANTCMSQTCPMKDDILGATDWGRRRMPLISRTNGNSIAAVKGQGV